MKTELHYPADGKESEEDSAFHFTTSPASINSGKNTYIKATVLNNHQGNFKAKNNIILTGDEFHSSTYLLKPVSYLEHNKHHIKKSPDKVLDDNKPVAK